MAKQQGKITRDEIVDKKVLELGKEYAKTVKLAIDANKKWLDSFGPIKAAALEYVNFQKQFKIPKTYKEFLQLKEKEEVLRKKTADAVRAEQNALDSANKKLLNQKREEQRLRKQAADAIKAEERAKQSAIDTINKQLTAENKALAIENKKQAAKKRSIKLTEEEKLEIRLLNRNAREMAVISSKLSTEYERQSVKLTRLKREYKDVALREGETSKEATRLRKEVQKLDTALKKVDSSTGDYQRNVGNYKSAWRGLGRIITTAAGAFGVFSAIEIGKQIYSQIKEIDALNKALKQITETQESYAQAQMFIIGLAEETGVEINELQKSYVKFYASAKTTNLTLAETQDIFRQTAKAGAVLGQSTEYTNGALRALEQMLSKGKVQAEEIRGQLGERLPGAFQILARSMGLTTAELSKQLELGNVYAEEVLPKFAKELAETYGLDKVDKVETLNAAQGRLSNSWNEFLRSMENGEGTITKTLTTLLGGLTKVVDLMKYLNDDGTIIGGDIYNKTLKERTKHYNEIAKSTEENWIAYQAQTRGFLEAEQVKYEAQQKAKKEVEEIAKIDLENSKKRIEAMEEEAKRLKESSQSLEIKIPQAKEDLGWFRYWDGSQAKLIEMEAQLGKNKEKMEKLNISILNQKAIRDGANAVLQESIDLEKKNKEVMDDGRRTYANVMADIKALREDLANSTKEEAPAILAKITALNKEKEAWERRNKSVKEATDLAFELAKFELEQKIEIQNKIFEDEEETFKAREKAIRKRFNLEVKLAKLTAAEKFAQTENFNKADLAVFKKTGILTVEQTKKLTDEQLLIYKQYQAEKNKITETKTDAQDSLEAERIEREAEYRRDVKEKEMNIEIQQESNALAEILQNEKLSQSEREAAIENHERKVAEIKRRYALEALNVQVAAIQQLLDSEELSKEKRAEYERQLSELKIRISELTLDKFIENNDKEVQAEKLTAQEILGIARDLSAALTDLANAIFDARISKIDEEIEKNNEKYNKWLENENLTEEQRNEIERKRDEKEAELEKKKRKEQRKQAILQKTMAAFSIGLTTAQAVIAALAPPPVGLGPVAGIPLSAVAAAIGAVQLAAVLAAPIPKYAKGTEDHPGGFALVGEERPEVVREPGTDPYIVSKPTVLDLPKGTKVTPSVDEYKKLMRASILSSIDINNKKLNDFQAAQSFDDHKMVEEMKLLRKAYEKNKTNVIVKQSRTDFDHELFRFKNTNWR